MPSDKRRNKAKPIISHPTLISRSDLSNFNDYVISFSPSADIAAGSGQTTPGSPTDVSDPPSSLRLSGALDVDIPSHHLSHFGPLSDDTTASQQAPGASPNPSMTESLHSIIPLKLKKNPVVKPVPETHAPVEEGDIVFRQAASRVPVRSLYTPTSGRRSFTSIDERANQSIPIPPIPSPTKTAVPSQVGIDGRRQSLVNPEDYMPGLPASVSGGKAMSAGFDPVRPAPLRKASYVPAPVGRRRSSLKGTVATARSALNTGPEADFDITEFVPNAYDHGRVYGLDSRKESLASEYADLPTLYSNNYVGQAVVNMPSSKVEGADSPNGKLDWRARFALKSSSPANLRQDSNEKFSVILSNDSSASLDEKSSNDHSYISHFKPSGFAGKKVSAHVVKLEAPGYSHLGRIMLRLSPVTFLLTTGATAFYLYLRATTLIKAQNTTGRDFRAAWAFLLSETVFAAWTFAYSLGQLVSLRLKPAPRYSIKGDVGLPTVDVLVICTGQDAAMVMDATVAAARLDWPVEKLRVLVVDETGSEIIKRSVDYYATNRALHVTYHRRGKNAIPPMGGWPKSSTINLGLSETRAEGRISGDYVVVLDAESIVEADFLRATLSHAMQNPLLALVQTKAGFYNLPKKLGSSFGTFMRCVEGDSVSRSGFVVRRSAIDDIGGFPTRSSIEDGRLKSCLEGKGYVTMAVDETLQYAMVPESFSHHLKQQVTRQLAHVGTALRLGFFLFSRRTLHMPFGSRLKGLGRALAPFFSILIFLNAVALPIALFYGGFLVPALSISELNTLIWAVFAALLMERVHDVFFAMPTGKATPRRFIQAQIFMAPYTMLGMLQSLVPRFLRRNVAPYWEPVEVGQPSERNSKCRIYFRHRLRSALFGTHGWTHILLLTSLLAAIGYSLYLSIQPFVTHQRSLYQTGLLLLMTVAWPTLPWMNVLLGSAVPFVYAIAPPTVPVREKLLNREPITGVARPLPERRRSSPFRQRHFGQFVLSMALIGYPLAVFVLTWTHIFV